MQKQNGFNEKLTIKLLLQIPDRVAIFEKFKSLNGILSKKDKIPKKGNSTLSKQ